MAKYHMHRKDREVHDREKMDRMLLKGKYAVISMCRGNEPYIVTLSYGYDPEGNALYFHCAPKGLKMEFIRENPAVCATVLEDHGYKMGECGHEYVSVVIRGSISVLDSLEDKKKGMEVILEHLEENPAAVKEAQIRNDHIFSKISILKLEIGEMTGKMGR